MAYSKQYQFHKQRIAYHRGSMKFYHSCLISKNINVVYIASNNELAGIRKLFSRLKTKVINALECIATTDYWLEERIRNVNENFLIKCMMRNKSHI